MSRLLRSLAVSGLLFIPATAHAQHSCDGYPPGTETTIAVYTNLEGTECTGETTNGVLAGSIWANLAGAAAGGITGAEYRVVVGNPSVYLNPYLEREPSIQYSPSPNAVLEFGDPFNGGTNIVFDTCQERPRILLGTFLLVESELSQRVGLYVQGHEAPSNFTFCCPLITLCDGPVFTKVCATGITISNPYDWVSLADCLEGRGYPGCDDEFYFAGVNSSTGWSAGQCPPLATGSPTGVSEATWSTVKSLYR